MNDRNRAARLIAPVTTLFLALTIAGCEDGATATSPTAAPPLTGTEVSRAARSTATATATGPAATPTSPACAPGQALTPAETEGPYFKAGSPEKANLVEPGMSGTRLVVSGTVRTPDCTAVARAVVDVWQADAAGAYDNSGYRLRGHVLTDENGRYSFETVVPGEYPGRTPHIHVKVKAPNGPVLTTQLYLSGVASNTRDSIYQPQMLVQDAQTTQSGMSARYDFIIAAS